MAPNYFARFYPHLYTFLVDFIYFNKMKPYRIYEIHYSSWIFSIKIIKLFEKIKGAWMATEI